MDLHLIVCESTLKSVKLTSLELKLIGMCVSVGQTICKPLCFVLYCEDILPSHSQYFIFSISYCHYCWYLVCVEMQMLCLC